jgi:cobalt-zinc-cadmium efflux system protein
MELNHTGIVENSVSKAFKTGIAINIIFVAIEAGSGFLANSMALVADAGHNLSDVLALAFSWLAVFLSQKKPTLKFTYGFRRSTILVALLNTILLLAAVSFITWETISRLSNNTAINSGYMMVVAAIGIAVNGFTAWLFMKGRDRDLNIRSAFLHFVADALVSFGVVVAGIIIAFTGFQWIDSVVSFSIIAVILYSSYHLLIDSVNLALDAVPDSIKIEEVSKFLENLPEVSGIHDLHIWALGTTEAALTVHLTTSRQTDVGFITSIQQQMREKFHIDHTTVQVEYGETDECGNEF